jgi:hypothetical protein
LFASLAYCQPSVLPRFGALAEAHLSCTENHEHRGLDVEDAARDERERDEAFELIGECLDEIEAAVRKACAKLHRRPEDILTCWVPASDGVFGYLKGFRMSDEDVTEDAVSALRFAFRARLNPEWQGVE